MSNDHIFRRRLSSYYPSYGAIFMANQSTKEECLERKLFGLPLPFSDFVSEVKIGMLLFLYDYHKRKLYGVFEASSNGGLDLVPNAYKSTKMCFPAQVRFNVLWQCAPLEENAFRDAIAENYYAKNRFNFGLSRDQVGRLLFLFEKTRLKIQRSKRCHQRPKADNDEPIDDNIWYQAYDCDHEDDDRNSKLSGRKARGLYSNDREERISVFRRLAGGREVTEEKNDSSSENAEHILNMLDKKRSIWQNECTERPLLCRDYEGVDDKMVAKRKKIMAAKSQKRKRLEETKTCNKLSLMPTLSQGIPASSVDDRYYPCESVTSMIVAGDAGITKEATFTNTFICEETVDEKFCHQISLETARHDNLVEMLLAEFNEYLSRWRIEDQNENYGSGQ